MEKRIPPLLLIVVFGGLMGLGARYLPGGALTFEWKNGLVWTLLLIGLAVCLAGVKSLKRARTTSNPMNPETSSTLVCSGIYGHTRNPMYLGFAILLMAWAIHLAWLPALLGVVGFVIYINKFQIEPEEQALKSLFGNEFTQYCNRVRRWL